MQKRNAGHIASNFTASFLDTPPLISYTSANHVCIGEIMSAIRGEQMNRQDVVLGIVVAIVGAIAFVLACQMPFYANQIPGPGFLPRIVSGGLFLLGGILAFQGYRPGGPEVRAIGSVPPWSTLRTGNRGQKSQTPLIFPDGPLRFLPAILLRCHYSLLSVSSLPACC